MNRPKRYKKTVDILFDAYFNDTLRHNNCYACACGNIIAANMGYKFVETLPESRVLQRDHSIAWDITGGYYSRKVGDATLTPWYRVVLGGAPSGAGLGQIASTGYKVHEFRMIEHAFERSEKGNTDEDWMFNGLVAVLDALKKIHEVEDNETDITKFRNHYTTLTK